VLLAAVGDGTVVRALQCRLGHGIGNSRVNLGRLGFLAEIDESSRAKE
jgi:NAD kinase